MNELATLVSDHESSGAKQVGLGIQSMPSGYALMLNADESHYYWLRQDGAESPVHWNKWQCYYGAVANAEAAASQPK